MTSEINSLADVLDSNCSRSLDFVDNKYCRWYFNIVKQARSQVVDGYSENHHVVPRCMGGTDSPENLVKLSARQHFICHMLLTKFVTGTSFKKVLHAAIFMKAKGSLQDRYINSRLYSHAKESYSKVRRESQQGNLNSFYGVSHSDSARKRMSESKKEAYSDGKHPHIGMKRSPETRANISAAKKGKPNPRKGTKGLFTMSTESKLRMAMTRANTCYWWTNGEVSIRGAVCPAGFRSGRLYVKKSDR